MAPLTVLKSSRRCSIKQCEHDDNVHSSRSLGAFFLHKESTHTVIHTNTPFSAVAISWSIIWLCAAQGVYGYCADGNKSLSGTVSPLPSNSLDGVHLGQAPGNWDTEGRREEEHAHHLWALVWTELSHCAICNNPVRTILFFYKTCSIRMGQAPRFQKKLQVCASLSPLVEGSFHLK